MFVFFSNGLCKYVEDKPSKQETKDSSSIYIVSHLLHLLHLPSLISSISYSSYGSTAQLLFLRFALKETDATRIADDFLADNFI